MLQYCLDLCDVQIYNDTFSIIYKATENIDQNHVYSIGFVELLRNCETVNVKDGSHKQQHFEFDPSLWHQC